MLEVGPSKRLFVTSQGLFGLEPATITNGDVVAIFLEFEVPMALKQCLDGKYEVVREVYLRGIMDGEAMDGPIVDVRRILIK
jgi:hypothetical protein